MLEAGVRCLVRSYLKQRKRKKKKTRPLPNSRMNILLLLPVCTKPPWTHLTVTSLDIHTVEESAIQIQPLITGLHILSNLSPISKCVDFKKYLKPCNQVRRAIHAAMPGSRNVKSVLVQSLRFVRPYVQPL